MLTALPGLRRVDPLSYPDWNAAIAGLPQKSFFYTAAWAEVLQTTYGYRPHYFVHASERGIGSLFPLMEVDSWLTGSRGISLPFADDCPLAAPDEKSFRRLLEDVVDFGRARGWRYLEFRGGRQWLPDAPSSVQFFEHHVDLSEGEPEIYRRLDGSIRRGIKKAQASHLHWVSDSSAPAMKEFYQLLCLTRRKHGLPPQPFEFFANIQKMILARGLGKLFLARSGGRPVAAAVYFFSGSEVIYKYGASDEQFQSLRPNNLVMWEAIKTFVKAGFKSLNLGRTSLSNGGLRRYKLGWGAREKDLDYFRYSFGQEGFTSGSDQAAGWHNRVFARLPAPVSRAFGNFLYRHWA